MASCGVKQKKVAFVRPFSFKCQEEISSNTDDCILVCTQTNFFLQIVTIDFYSLYRSRTLPSINTLFGSLNVT